VPVAGLGWLSPAGDKQMTKAISKSGLNLARQARHCLEVGDIDQAEKICNEALRQYKADPDLLLQIGNVHYFRKRYDEAADLFQQVQKLRPKDSEARTMLWGTYRDAGDFDQMLNLALEFQNHPLNTNEVFLAYRSFLAVCDWQNAEKIQEHIFTLFNQQKISLGLISAILIDLCSIPGLSPKVVYDIHRQWGDEEIKGKQAYFPANSPAVPVNGRLKLAYISADFNAHPVGAFINQVIQSHDRQRFEIYCYAYLERNDAFTQHFRVHAEHFIDITTLRYEEVADRIHADGIDILIELGGHTTNSRLPVLAYKPAPVQITYLGYPNTTGLPTVDYRITDHFAECEEGTQYVEKLLYMPQSFLCLGSGLAQPASAIAPVEKKGYITFASLNHIRKLNPQTIQAWSQILNRVPDSKLMLKVRAVETGVSIVHDNVLSEFASHGINAERIAFLPYTDSHKEHMLQ
jgi:predicted O-linked N-acetylglucosamine transferase (SPINDLY family)